MKYKDTTPEQRESITPYLLARFIGCKTGAGERNITKGTDWTLICGNNWICPKCLADIKAYQQAQKAEIEDLEIKQKTRRIFLGKDIERIKYKTGLSFIEAIIKDDDVRIDKLKFESELE